MFSMQDVMHCNKCSVKFNNIVPFFLAECGHIFCDKCNEKLGQSGKCIVCNKTTNSIKFDKEMAPEIQKFFSPIEPQLQSALQSVIEVSGFQRQHGSSYMQFMLRKYNDAKKRCIQFHVENQNLKKEIHYLKSMINSGGGQHSFPFVTSTPAARDVSLMNMSTMSSLPFTPANASKYPGFGQRVGSNGGNMKGVHNVYNCTPCNNPADTALR